MDLRLFAAVMKRYKKLVGFGTLAAIVLALLSYGTPTLSHGMPTIKPRGAEVWEAQAEVLITEPSDPYGRISAAVTGAVGSLSSLSSVYAAVANGSGVETAARRESGVKGIVQSAEVIDQSTGNPMPLITMTASAPTAASAVKLAVVATHVLQRYVAGEQQAGSVAPAQRIVLMPVKNGTKPLLASGPKYTTAMLVLVVLLGGVCTLAFVLENLNPRTAEALGRAPKPAEGHDAAATLLAALTSAHRVAPAPAVNGNGNGQYVGAGVGIAHEPRPADGSTNGAAREQSHRPRTLMDVEQGLRTREPGEPGSDAGESKGGQTQSKRLLRWRA